MFLTNHEKAEYIARKVFWELLIKKTDYWVIGPQLPGIIRQALEEIEQNEQCGNCGEV